MKLALVGDSEPADALRNVGADLVAPDEATVVVAVGEGGVETAATAADAPVLPVGVGGVSSVSRSKLDDALEALIAGDWTTVEHPLLAASVENETVARAVFDATLVAARPATISEFAVRLGGEEVAEFRADGIVVATPLGSAGYAHAAGGPVLSPGTGVSVVPIGAFSAHVDSWVTDDPVTLTVERDDGPVSLLAEADDVRAVSPGERVRIEPDGWFDLVRVSTATPSAESPGRED